MATFIQKNWIHIVIWVGMLIYVMAATPFYARYVLKDGKPIAFDEELPQRTKRITYSLDRFDPVVLRGQSLYHLFGWAFVSGDPTSTAYERLLVLQSDSHTYFFSIADYTRPDLQNRFPDLHLPLDTGFAVHISKDAIEQGIYRIGFLFKHRENGTQYYLLTNEKIMRTPNKLQRVAQ
jgi:hypothetical protein